MAEILTKLIAGGLALLMLWVMVGMVIYRERVERQFGERIGWAEWCLAGFLFFISVLLWSLAELAFN